MGEDDDSFVASGFPLPVRALAHRCISAGLVATMLTLWIHNAGQVSARSSARLALVISLPLASHIVSMIGPVWALSIPIGAACPSLHSPIAIRQIPYRPSSEGVSSRCDNE